MMSYRLIFTLVVLAALVVSSRAQNTFKLHNAEMRSFVVDLDSPGGRTLVSRRYAEGVTFTVDKTTGRLKTSTGFCIHTGPGDVLQLNTCDQSADQWYYYQDGDFAGFALGSTNQFMACWDTGTDWLGPYRADGEPLRKTSFQSSGPELGCVWIKVQA